MNLREIFADKIHDIPIDAPASGQDGYTLVYNETLNKYEWVEITLGAHTHVEADITDLEHNAIQIQGIPVESPGSGDDGKFYQYNQSLNTFELVEISGLDEVTPDNPIATYNDIYSAYIADDTESTTTNNEYQQKVRLTVTVPIPGDYMVMFSCEVYNSVANKGVRVRMQQNDTITLTLNESSSGLVLAGSYMSIAGFAKATIGSGSTNFDLDYCRSVGNPPYTVGIRRARIYLKRTLL